MGDAAATAAADREDGRPAARRVKERRVGGGGEGGKMNRMMGEVSDGRREEGFWW
jgi:hypothetical protein